MDISINNISKSFGDKLVLQNFSTIIYEHQYNFIMGPSGCGKTTLLNILMGFLCPDSGTITGVPDKKSAVFQEDRLCDSFNAVSNVRMVCTSDIDTQTIKEHLASVGIKENSIHLPVCELSGGMRRRVAIVRSILAESEVIFMDEPFKGLDTNTKQVVIQYVKENTQGKTVILVTHDPDEVKEFDGNLVSMDIIEK
ncbi:MAG TPA: ATP-binding cassette domain-containing protein [Clostridiaceae bacterium]|nr:ATP-binding cassette domain-containing protein [Clostridiaceae bacterium]